MSETRIITGKVRFSYAHVFTPKPAENEGDKPTYQTMILIPKDDKKTVDKINAAIEAAIVSGVAKWGGKRPKNIKTPLRDPEEEDGRDGKEYDGHYFLNAKTALQPGIVDKNREEIIDEDEFYSGCYGRASITFYPFDSNGNKGIAVALNNIQKLADGERLDGRVDAADEFADDFEDEDDEI